MAPAALFHVQIWPREPKVWLQMGEVGSQLHHHPTDKSTNRFPSAAPDAAVCQTGSADNWPEELQILHSPLPHCFYPPSSAASVYHSLPQTGQGREWNCEVWKMSSVRTLTWRTWRTLRGRSRSLWQGRPHIPGAWAGFLPRCGIFDRHTIWKRRKMRGWDPGLHTQFKITFISINS